MKKKLAAILFVVPLIINSFAAHSAPMEEDMTKVAKAPATNGWLLVRDDAVHNIKAYAKQEDEKKFRTFRVEALMDAPLETVARVQFDVDNIKKWFWSTSESKLLKKVSDREFYYYQVYRTPLVPDRDVIIHAVIEPYTVKKGFMGLKINAVPDYMPDKSGLVRMAAHEIVFKFTPVGEDKTKLEFDGYIDPSGVSPAWAINYYQRKSPYISVIGMQRMLLRPEYRETKEPMPFTYKE
jgi:hypothetical protein